MNKIYKHSSCLFFSLLFYATTFGQISVKGYVQIENGEALPGIHILEKGTINGTTTNDHGFYEIKVADKTAILEFSLVGYQMVEKPVRNGSIIYVQLQPKSTTLQRAIVTALGIEKAPEALPYATSEIKGIEVSKAQEISLGNVLSGRIAGVNVTQLGTGGAGSSRIIIRGNSSITGGNQPLIVVDGVPMNNDNLGSPDQFGGADYGDGLSRLNANDIEKITVLKGMTAAALYGSRASNGAILVTTKRGNKTQGLQVTYNTKLAMSQPILYWDFQDEYGQGWTPDSLPQNQQKALGSNWGNFGPRLNGQDAIQFDGSIRPFENTNHDYKGFYQNGFTINNTLSLSGKNENFNFRWSLSDLRNQGIVPNNDYNRQTMSVSADGKFSQRLNASLSMQYSKESSDNRPRVSNVTGNPHYALATIPANTPLSSLQGLNGDGANAAGFEISSTDYNRLTNPYWAVNRFKNEDQKNRLIGSLLLKYNLTEHFWIQGRIATDFLHFNRFELTPYGTAYAWQGSIFQLNSLYQENNLDFLIGYEKKTDSGFGIKANFGGNRMKNRSKTEWVSASTFVEPFVEIYNNTKYRTPGQYISERAINSLYGSLEVSIEDYLFATLTARNDWYSTLTPKNNNLFFPSLGLSWIFSKNLNLPSCVNFGKLRISGASVGSDVGPYSLDLSYNIQGIHQNQPLVTISNYALPNASLSPGLSTELELGLEAKFFDYRIGIDVAVYQSQNVRENVIAGISVTSGFNQAFFPNGKIRNRGIELTINANPIRQKNFSWITTFNIAKNKNEVLNLGSSVDSLQIFSIQHATENVFIKHVVGHPASSIVGYPYLRDENGEIVHNEDGFPMAGNLAVLGNGVHDLTGGFFNEVIYKNIKLGFLIDYKFGGEIFSGTNAMLTILGKHKNTLRGREDGLIGEGVNEAGAPNDFYFSTDSVGLYYKVITEEITEEFVYDADFIKLREVTLGYVFSKKLFPKLPFQSLECSLFGRNLLLLHSKLPNVDPESIFRSDNVQGIELFGVPSTRNFGININVNF